MYRLPQYSVAKQTRISTGINQCATITGVSGPPEETVTHMTDCFQRQITQENVGVETGHLRFSLLQETAEQRDKL